jgi:hypothetical protein
MLDAMKPTVQKRYRTYFSTKGEQKTCFERTQLVTDMLHTLPLTVTYDYPAWAVLRKPLVALGTVLFVLMSLVFALKPRSKRI